MMAFLAVVLVSCAPENTVSPPIKTPLSKATITLVQPSVNTILTSIITMTPIPNTATKLLTATKTSTPTPKPTNTPVPTPTPIYVMLGSPFASDCGDGVPVILSNNSFNGPFRADGFGSGSFGQSWGHMDIFVPNGCDVNSYNGEVTSPVNGTIQRYDFDGGWGYKIFLPNDIFIDGIIDALKFSGVKNPKLKKISQVTLDLGHVDLVEGKVEKGKVIGNIVPCCGNHKKLAYHVIVIYAGTEYMLSPTLFPNVLPDGTILRPMLNGSSENWICAKDSYAKNYPNSNGDCVPEKFDYKP